MNVYESIVRGLNEAIAYEKGELEVRTVKVSVAPLPDMASNDVKNIRLSLDMTQAIFAAVMGVSVKTVEAWESGINTPSGTARRMLSLLKSDPQLPEKYNLLSR